MRAEEEAVGRVGFVGVPAYRGWGGEVGDGIVTEMGGIRTVLCLEAIGRSDLASQEHG